MLPKLRQVFGPRQQRGQKAGTDTLQKRKYLREIDIFCDLSQDDVQWLETTTRMATVRKGEIIYRQGETAQELFLLKRGKVRLSRLTPHGKKLDLAVLEPGTFFGEMPLLGERLRNAYAEAVEESVVCIMSQENIERLVLAKPQVALRLLEVLGRRLAESEARLEDMAYRSVSCRLASALLRLCGNRTDVIDGITHEELGDIVGAYRVTVTKTLNEFQSAGYIEMARRRIRIVNRSQLASLLADASDF